MLGSSHIMAFVATTDAAKTRAFYEGALGLRLVSDEQYALVFDANGTTLRAQKVQSVVAPPYTSLGWIVDDVRAKVEELRARGVTFERYGGLEQDDLGIWSSGRAQIAWFKDPEGHTLSLVQG
jgi:catechol 2,3-dioxygenase-like lactoylglutathione lyase family enzyme